MTRIVPKEENQISVLSNSDSIMNDCLNLIEVEVHLLRNKQRQGDEVNFRKLTEYIKALVSISKERRESVKGDTMDLKSMSLLELKGMMEFLDEEIKSRTKKPALEMDEEE